MSIDGRMDKEDVVHTYHKKNEMMPFAATWMYLEIIILSEESQTEEDKYHDIVYMWNLLQLRPVFTGS